MMVGGQALLMISLGLGYFVVYFAKKADKPGLRLLGYVIGTIILMVTMFLLMASFHPGYDYMPQHKMMRMMPRPVR